MSQNIKTGATVKIIAGKNKGQTAKVVCVDRENSKAMLENIGIRERHMRANQFNPKGSKKTIHVGIDLSNLKVVEAAKKVEKKAKKGAK